MLLKDVIKTKRIFLFRFLTNFFNKSLKHHWWHGLVVGWFDWCGGVQNTSQRHLGLDATVLDVLAGAFPGLADDGGSRTIDQTMDLGAAFMNSEVVLSCTGLVKRFGASVGEGMGRVMRASVPSVR